MATMAREFTYALRLIRRNKGAMEEVRAFSADLHSVLLSGAMATSEAARAMSVKKVG